MNRKFFLKSLAVITGSIAIAPQMGLTLIEQKERERPLNLDELRRRKLAEYKIQMERAFLFGIVN